MQQALRKLWLACFPDAPFSAIPIDDSECHNGNSECYNGNSECYNSEPFSVVLHRLQWARVQEALRKLWPACFPHAPFSALFHRHQWVQEALRKLWLACFPDAPFSATPNAQWKDAGFQGKDPATDFRGGGVFALFNLLYMAHTYPLTFQRLLHKKDGSRSDWEYPFCAAGALADALPFCTEHHSETLGVPVLCRRCAPRRNTALRFDSVRLQKCINVACFCSNPFVAGNLVRAGINVTVRLEELVGLRGPGGAAPAPAAAAATPAAAAFADLLLSSEAAFDELYVAAFDVLDQEWLEARASYMQFPAVLDSTLMRVRAALAARPASVAALRVALQLPEGDH